MLQHFYYQDAKGVFIYGLSYDNHYGETLDPDIETNPKVLVFDWEGMPTKEIVLEDGRFIQSFTVDEKTTLNTPIIRMKGIITWSCIRSLELIIHFKTQ